MKTTQMSWFSTALQYFIIMSSENASIVERPIIRKENIYMQNRTARWSIYETHLPNWLKSNFFEYFPKLSS